MHMRSSFRAFAALQCVIIGLMMAALACTSNDTLFIHLTDTPIPSLTPTPLSIPTRFKKADKASIVADSDFASLQLASLPGLPKAGDFAGTCFHGTSVTIQDVAKSSDAADKRLFYLVTCSGKSGWIPEPNLSHFVKSAAVIVKTPDGKGATLYSDPSQTSKPASATPCADGTKLSIDALRSAATPTDLNVYAQVTCGAKTGYVIEDLLTAVPKS